MEQITYMISEAQPEKDKSACNILSGLISERRIACNQVDRLEDVITALAEVVDSPDHYWEDVHKVELREGKYYLLRRVDKTKMVGQPALARWCCGQDGEFSPNLGWVFLASHSLAQGCSNFTTEVLTTPKELKQDD